MIRVEQHGPVTAIRMSRAIFGRPLYWTAAYWVDGLLIDAGPVCTAEELADVVTDLGVNQIVVTHAHEDHFGGLDEIVRRFPDATIYAPRAGMASIADPALLQMHSFRRLLWGMPSSVQNVHSLDEIAAAIITPSFSFRIIDTPGHSPDHISLFEPERQWLFCGDAFIGGQDRVWMRDYDLFSVVSSLRTMASLAPERMFPGSGNVREEPVSEIGKKIDFYTDLAKQVATLDADGLSVQEMAQQLLHGENHMRFLTNGYCSAQTLIEACLSYNSIIGPADPAGLDPAENASRQPSIDKMGPPETRSSDYYM